MTYEAQKARPTMTFTNENAKVVELGVKWIGKTGGEGGDKTKRDGKGKEKGIVSALTNGNEGERDSCMECKVLN
jgi:hypothetical protein